MTKTRTTGPRSYQNENTANMVLQKASKKILIVEDDLFSQKLFTYILTKMDPNLDIEIVSSYKDLKQKLNDLNQVNLAVVDINLEDEQSGIDVLNLLFKRNIKTTFILTTGLPKREYKKIIPNIYKHIPVLKKPFLPEKCINLIKGYLNKIKKLETD